MHRLGQLALAGALGVALCSCAQQQAQIAAQPQAQIAAPNSEVDAQCREYGGARGTPAYNRCLAKGAAWDSDGRSANKELGIGAE